MPKLHKAFLKAAKANDVNAMQKMLDAGANIDITGSTGLGFRSVCSSVITSPHYIFFFFCSTPLHSHTSLFLKRDHMRSGSDNVRNFQVRHPLSVPFEGSATRLCSLLIVLMAEKRHIGGTVGFRGECEKLAPLK